jgi:spore maturation protein CgeB
MKLNIVIFGLTITSSWGNGHAVTYRALIRALHRRGHNVTFLEREVPWYREHRDLEEADYCAIGLYRDLREAPARFGATVRNADLVILGSYVPDGIALAEWITGQARGVTAFYDIDTPVTLAGLESGKTAYISAPLIPRFDLYLSFTGGPILQTIEQTYGSPRARALYCTADVDIHAPRDLRPKWALGYLGTYSADRQPALERLLLQPAAQLANEDFVVVGPQYPSNLKWPKNVARIDHLPPREHPAFYGKQRFTLNITRANMVSVGFSPSVRLFEAAASGVPIITDRWAGLESFFTPGKEILVADGPNDVICLLKDVPEDRRHTIAAEASKRFLKNHTPDDRARQLENHYAEVVAEQRPLVGAEVA